MEFYRQCKEVLDDEECSGETRFFVEALLATTEYDMFFPLMQAEMYSHRRQRNKK